MKQSLAMAYATKRRIRTKTARPEPIEPEWQEPEAEELALTSSEEPAPTSSKPDLRNIIQKLRKQKMTQNEG